MNTVWKKGILFVMLMSTVSILANSRATLYLAGYVESLSNLFIIPRVTATTGLNVVAGGTLVVADVVEESNLVNGYTIHGWSLNNSQLCDGNQTQNLPPADPYNPTATNAGVCTPYTVTYTATSTATATVTAGTVNATVGADTATAVLLSTTAPPVPGTITGVVLGAISISINAPVNPLPAGLYDDTLVLEMRAL